MKLTKSQLKQIIREELSSLQSEEIVPRTMENVRKYFTVKKILAQWNHTSYLEAMGDSAADQNDEAMEATKKEKAKIDSLYDKAKSTLEAEEGWLKDPLFELLVMYKTAAKARGVEGDPLSDDILQKLEEEADAQHAKEKEESEALRAKRKEEFAASRAQRGTKRAAAGASREERTEKRRADMEARKAARAARRGGRGLEENTESQIKQMIQEELEKSGYLGNGYKWCPAGTKCAPQQTKTKWWRGR